MGKLRPSEDRHLPIQPPRPVRAHQATVYCKRVDTTSEIVRQGMARVYVQFESQNWPLSELEHHAGRVTALLIGVYKPCQALAMAARGKKRIWLQNDPAVQWITTPPEVLRGQNSMIYQLPPCPNFDSVCLGNLVISRPEAEVQRKVFPRHITAASRPVPPAATAPPPAPALSGARLTLLGLAFPSGFGD